MFTWICPQCGREVPPSYSECPTCAENRQRAAQGLPPVGSEPVAQRQPPPPQYQPVNPPPPPAPPQYQPAQPQYIPPQQTYTLPDSPQRKGLPAWLVTILVAVVAIGLISGIVRLLGGKGSSSVGSAATSQQQTAASDSSNPYAKYIEVTGIRVVEDAKKHANAQFLVVNHSSADLPGLELEITLTTTTAKAGDDPLAVVTVKTGDLPANGSKDVATPLNTKLRAYELPDWQFLKASFAIKTSH